MLSKLICSVIIIQYFALYQKFNCNFTSRSRITYKPLMYIDYTNFTAESFNNELNNNLNDFMAKKLSCTDCSNLNKLYDKFVSIVKHTIDLHSPMKLASRNQRKLLKRFWLIKNILMSIKKLYKTHFLSNNEILIASHKR